jgi:hypothetical protein
MPSSSSVASSSSSHPPLKKLPTPHRRWEGSEEGEKGPGGRGGGGEDGSRTDMQWESLAGEEREIVSSSPSSASGLSHHSSVSSFQTFSSSPPSPSSSCHLTLPPPVPSCLPLRPLAFAHPPSSGVASLPLSPSLPPTFPPTLHPRDTTSTSSLSSSSSSGVYTSSDISLKVRLSTEGKGHQLPLLPFSSSSSTSSTSSAATPPNYPSPTLLSSFPKFLSSGYSVAAPGPNPSSTAPGSATNPPLNSSLSPSLPPSVEPDEAAHMLLSLSSEALRNRDEGEMDDGGREGRRGEE